jgi:hypothetical protein
MRGGKSGKNLLSQRGKLISEMTREEKETRDYSFHNWPVTRAERRIFPTGELQFSKLDKA